jgi:arginase
MDVVLIQVPYHLGHERVGMGRGPERLLEAGAADALREAGHSVTVERVRRREEHPDEIGASFEVVRLIAEHVRAAVGRGGFPLVLSGNCIASIGTVAGIGEDVGVVWFDAHPDFNTAESTTSGFVDGMGLSILTGTGWNALRETVRGYRPVPEASVVLVGIRDIDASERERLDRSDVAVVLPHESDHLNGRLDALRTRAHDVYLHVDLDVLDPSEGRANEYAADGGLTAAQLAEAVAAVRKRHRIRAAAVTAYDPESDPEGDIPEIAIRLMTAIADASAGPAGAAAA